MELAMWWCPPAKFLAPSVAARMRAFGDCGAIGGVRRGGRPYKFKGNRAGGTPALQSQKIGRDSPWDLFDPADPDG